MLVFWFIEIDCGPPRNTTHAAVVVNGTTFEDTANYTCEVGFRFPSGASLVVTSCNGTGNWTMANETCQGQHTCKHVRTYARPHARPHARTYTPTYAGMHEHRHARTPARTHTPILYRCVNSHIIVMIPTLYFIISLHIFSNGLVV